MEDRFKVRLWDTCEERYIYNAQNEIHYCEALHDSRYIPEQCTGTKDKNGNLIYEGDIVRTPIFYHGKPIGENKTFLVKYGNSGFNIFTLNGKYLEIIGNIHENRELWE